MVKPAASLFFLASTAGLLFGIEARDLKTGNNLPSRRSSHVEVAHRFAARLTDDNAHSVHTNLVSEAKDEDEGSITTDVYGPPLDGQTGILSKDPNLHILQQQQQSKRQATSTLLPSRNAKCSNLRIPAFDSSLVDKVKSNLAATGGDSWVSGTRMEALLEYDTPSLSVYSTSYYNNARNALVVNSEVNAITKTWLDKLPANAKTMVVDGGAAGDTAAVGVGFVNAGLSGQPASDRQRYRLYAARELDYLFRDVKRINGAISHRPPTEPPQAWNDFVYMAPPFFAYWGVLNNNFTIAQQAHKQIKAYRDLMRDPATGFWRHVTNNGQWEDANFWGTGMAWVAAGMTRTYATYKNGPFAKRLAAEMSDLANWTNEILKITFAHQNSSSGLLPNAYNAGANSDWDDTASSALLASAAFRLAQFGVLNDETAMIGKAAWIRQGIRGALDKETGWMWAVNPLDWYVKTDKSPESMAFVILMEAAARDYRAKIGC